MTKSLDLTAFRFENDSPAAAHHPVPLHEVTWPMIGVFAVVIGLVGVGVFALLVWLIPGQEQPPSSASLNSAPQPSLYSQGMI